MNRTFKLSESVLALGEDYLQSGREQEALQILGKLAAFGELPSDIAEQTEAHLAEIYFKQRRFKKARRHLHAALARDPECADYHYLMAAILEEEGDGDAERLLYHYEKAVTLEPNEPEYSADFGLFLIDAGEVDEGLKHLKRAVECAEEPFKYVRLLAFNLVEAGDAAEARRVVVAAMFRYRRDSRLKKLLEEVRLREALYLQRQVTQTWSTSAKPVLLPFRRKETTKTKCTHQTSDGKIIRVDPPEEQPKPHSSLRAKRS